MSDAIFDHAGAECDDQPAAENDNVLAEEIGRVLQRSLENDVEQVEAMVRTMIAKAKEGDGRALHFCLERIAPARKDRPVAFDLRPVETIEDAETASTEVIAAVSAGELTPREGKTVVDMLVAFTGMVEAGSQERRLRALEVKLRK